MSSEAVTKLGSVRSIPSLPKPTLASVCAWAVQTRASRLRTTHAAFLANLPPVKYTIHHFTSYIIPNFAGARQRRISRYFFFFSFYGELSPLTFRSIFAILHAHYGQTETCFSILPGLSAPNFASARLRTPAPDSGEKRFPGGIIPQAGSRSLILPAFKSRIRLPAVFNTYWYTQEDGDGKLSINNKT